MDPSTLAVVLGRPEGAGQPLGAGVSLTATYRAGGAVVYGRDDNRSWQAFEAVLGALEGGLAVSFSSGMAAVAAVVESLPVGAGVVVGHDAYYGVRVLLAELAERGRLAVTTVDMGDTPAAVAAFDGAALAWLESPTNPRLAVADLPALIGAARAAGAVVAVDNTFATPLLQQPLAMGADVVVHSVTKLLAGHSDLVMGAAVAATDEWRQRLLLRRGRHGAVPGPFEAWLALRGLRTLPVRLERAQATAAALAGRLAGHPAVERVRWPGFGTMVSFDVRGGAGPAAAVEGAVGLIVNATSLGGVETLIERRAKYAGEAGTPEGLLRMSVGLEHVDDLWRDLEQALAAVEG
jgi:cystathionine gamma-synthase